MTIRVTGIPELNRDLRRFSIDMEDLKDAMGRLADMGAKAAAGHAPKRSGALAASVRGTRAKNEAVVTAGTGRASKYAGVINYGSLRRGISARHFMQQADADIAPKIIPILSADLDRLIRQRGLK
jgi:phage gpG-like protein